MPFKIVKDNGRFQLQKRDGKKVAVKFKTKDSAISSAKQYIFYREKRASIFRPRNNDIIPIGAKIR